MGDCWVARWVEQRAAHSAAYSGETLVARSADQSVARSVGTRAVLKVATKAAHSVEK